jgi:hypothetical protein
VVGGVCELLGEQIVIGFLGIFDCLLQLGQGNEPVYAGRERSQGAHDGLQVGEHSGGAGRLVSLLALCAQVQTSSTVASHSWRRSSTAASRAAMA